MPKEQVIGRQITEILEAYLNALPDEPTGRLERRSVPREISSGAIHDEGSILLGHVQVLIEANTSKGLERFRGVRIPGGDPQSDTPALRQMIAALSADRFFVDDLKHLGRTWSEEDPDDVSAAEDAEIDVDEPDTENALLDRLASSTGRERCELICEAEARRFTPEQRQRLLPILWDYILSHRDYNDREELVAVSSAIRKYIAMMDVSQVGEVALLLEAGHRVVLPLDLELEVAKMVYRKFEANPPIQPDPQPQLAARLWEIASAYLNPRVLLRDKHATVASLAIEALVAMRSRYAEPAFQAAITCQFAWFGQMVSNNLVRLRDRWASRNPEVSNWCDDLLNRMAKLREENASARSSSH